MAVFQKEAATRGAEAWAADSRWAVPAASPPLLPPLADTLRICAENEIGRAHV